MSLHTPLGDLTVAEEDGAIVACQGGTAYYPLTRLGASGQDVLVVSGLGPVGLLATLFGSRMGAEVVGIDPSPDRRAFAEKLGAPVAMAGGAAITAAFTLVVFMIRRAQRARESARAIAASGGS